ncbi:uncharacterized protein AB675_7090 [Cyphellophora attinorum]|uniref:Cytochrome b561 domain-containing protein n=1 Tax=Cyphellophora attinorum TaxID=1664694 RepID=A0A0N1H8D2_9EURO|nr:uncharacterized protein AB675_7090 [Phialophora attinorum]KPI43193.1 hypothetical protein AB675_7090 [Phialophora attinorum]
MSDLAPPGSSTYNSGTMHVGDGTWDAGRDSFLLPNLVGLNFATMRYNGMGNRFFSLNGYHSLIRAHAVIAAITFLGLIPGAILLHRFLGRHEFWARRLHIWLSILALLLATVAFILGFIAVGPERSLSNPHHGIGVALYTLLWFEAINGCLWRNRKKNRLHWPLSLMIHTWLGRATALLGIVQVPLGLTLYGSPAFLFVLYTLWVFGLLVLYFVLEWVAGRRIERHGGYGTGYGGSDASYYTEHVTTRPGKKEGGGMGKWLAAGAGAVGLAALWRRRSDRENREKRPHPGVGTESSASSWWESEEEKQRPQKQRTGFGTRLMEVGAVAGGVAAVRSLFGRKERDDASHVGPYRPPLGGNTSYTSTSDSMSRVEEGLPHRPVTPGGPSPGHVRPSHPLAQPPMTPGSATPGAPLTPGRRPSDDAYSYYSYMSGSPSHQDRKGNTIRNALAAGGAMFAVKSLFKNRRQKKEERRAEELRKQRLEEERIARANSAHKYTGDGVRPPRTHRHGRMGSQTASDMSSIMDEPGTLPVAGTAGAAAASALADRNRIRPVGADPAIVMPGPPTAIPTNIPPVPPPHRYGSESSGSELYTTADGRQKHRHRNEIAAGLAGAAAGAMATDAINNRRRRQDQNTDSGETPPVSVHVKQHADGRHVTLRKLTEEEQAAQRRRERRASAAGRRRRNSSLSSSDLGEVAGNTKADRRWRRTEALEAQQAATNAAAAGPSAVQIPAPPMQVPYPTPPTPGTQAVDPRTGQLYTLPVPPPIPGSTSNLAPPGSITSPGTEASSAGTEYANNRRRRRAERAQARLAREGRQGNTVDFT